LNLTLRRGLRCSAMTENQREWTIGELAESAEITVRTLHHYDQIELLPPGERSGGGHRRYTASDVERLYRILTLRRLGFRPEHDRLCPRRRPRLAPSGDPLAAKAGRGPARSR
jgi:MerR HTH family regulatory protein